MSEIKALEKLRKLAICDKGEKYTAYLDAGNIADEIEAEIKERFIGLPVDADGAVIHPGDTLIVKDSGYGVECAQLFLATNGLWAIAGRRPDEFVHYKPRTIEGVLKEVMAETRLAVNTNGWIVEKYAAEIRELMGAQE